MHTRSKGPIATTSSTMASTSGPSITTTSVVTTGASLSATVAKGPGMAAQSVASRVITTSEVAQNNALGATGGGEHSKTIDFSIKLAVSGITRLFNSLTIANFQAEDLDHLNGIEEQVIRHWRSFEHNHMSMVSHAEQLSWDQHMQLYENVEYEYTSNRTICNREKRRLTSLDTPRTETAANDSERATIAEVRLEKIKIPRFDGQPHN